MPQRLKETAEELLRQGQAQLAEEYSQLWRILCGVLDQMAEILGEMELSGEEFARLLRLVLTQYSVGSIPAPQKQVTVSELAAYRGGMIPGRSYSQFRPAKTNEK